MKQIIFIFALSINLIQANAQTRTTNGFCKIAVGTDPCKRFNSKDIPYLDSRHPDIKYSSSYSDNSKYCDQNALRNDIWYISDWSMSTRCVEPEACGSRFPIWLNGSLPSVADDIVTRDGCVRSHDSCCMASYELQIKNCSLYTIYCFLKTPVLCPQRFCFDIDRTKVTPEPTSSTSPTTTRTTPVKVTSAVPVSVLCKRYNLRDFPYLDSRHPDIRYTVDFSDNSKFCDRDVLALNVWYVSDWPMTTTCVAPEGCGSRFPIWLNGTLPTVADGIVTRDACVRSHTQCCQSRYEVQIMNCAVYMIYRFLALPSACPQRYCIDIDKTKVTTETTTKFESTKPGTTATPRPTIPGAADTELCKRYNLRDFPYLDSRHPDIPYSLEFSDNSKFCDRDVLALNVWYVSDWPMTTTCVPPEGCGSRFPIWLNGTLPTVADGIVTRDACVRGHTQCCQSRYEVQIMNCAVYMIYRFLALPSACPQRYCINIMQVTTIPTKTILTDVTTPAPTTTEKQNEISDASDNSRGGGLFLALICLLHIVIG